MLKTQADVKQRISDRADDPEQIQQQADIFVGELKRAHARESRRLFLRRSLLLLGILVACAASYSDARPSTTRNEGPRPFGYWQESNRRAGQASVTVSGARAAPDDVVVV